MTNKFMKRRDKIRAQMKSRFYYMFWGAATVAVVGDNYMLVHPIVLWRSQ